MGRLSDIIAALEELVRPDCECMGCPCRAYQVERDALEMLKEYHRQAPCKPEDVVYHIHNDRVVKGIVYKITIFDANGNGFIQVDFEEDDLKKLDCDLKLWGVDLFSTFMEADIALREQEQ